MPPFLTGRAEPASSRRSAARGAAPAQAARGSVAANLGAGAAAGAVVLQLALAQVTLGLAAAFLVIAALTRWRPAWLIWPAIAGLCWIAAIGAARAGAGYVAGAGHLVGVVTGPGPMAAQLREFDSVAAGWQRWLPAQFPVALVVAAAEAGVAGRLAARGPYRPGLLVIARRRYVRASLRRGEVATSEGGSVGVIADTGRRAAVSWREAADGVLVTGQEAAAVASTCLDLATAAILHRKTALIIDLTSGAIAGGQDGRPGAVTVPASVLGSVADTCASADAPLEVFGQGRDRYEPFSEAGPAGAAGLLIDMTGLAEAEAGHARRAFCADYAQAAFEVIAIGAGRADTRTAAAAAHRQVGILDELAMLLSPGALRARLGHAAGPAADAALRNRVAALTSQVPGDQLAPLAARLARLLRDPAGALLSQPPPGAGTRAISLARALAARQVVLFPLGPRAHGAGGAMVARLVAADLMRVLADRAGLTADCLLWINGCEAMDVAGLAAVLESCQAAGAATMLSTADAGAAAALAARLNVVIVRGRPPQGLTSQDAPVDRPRDSLASVRTWPAGRAGLAGETLLCESGSDVLPADMLAERRADALSLRVRGPVPRIVNGARVAR
jgi:hypothetical protein